jgi:hypothetical protein
MIAKMGLKGIRTDCGVVRLGGVEEIQELLGDCLLGLI